VSGTSNNCIQKESLFKPFPLTSKQNPVWYHTSLTERNNKWHNVEKLQGAEIA
jgi:hypothetical protein